MSIDQIRNEIERIKDNESKLYSYLYDLTYQEISTNVRFLETIYSRFLEDKRTEIKRVAIYCLLFGLQIRKSEYKKVALTELKNKLGDSDLRLTCASGLAQAYLATDDKDLLSVFYSIFNDPDEDEGIRSESFVGMMKVHGMNSTKILEKNLNKIIMSVDDLYLENFEQEIDEIKGLIE
jgi:hypothetical protein